MAQLIKIDDVVVDKDAEAFEIATQYHKELCGCHRTDKEELAPYIERVTELIEEGVLECMD